MREEGVMTGAVASWEGRVSPHALLVWCVFQFRPCLWESLWVLPSFLPSFLPFISTFSYVSVFVALFFHLASSIPFYSLLLPQNFHFLTFFFFIKHSIAVWLCLLTITIELVRGWLIVAVIVIVMGNCLDSSAKVDAAAHSSRTTTSGISKTSRSSAPSNLSTLSYSQKSDSSSLPTPRSEGEILSCPNLKAFLFNELKNATRNFRPDSLLGEGGFGYVYKGWLDEHTFTASKPGSGMVVAVKKLKPEGFQGHKEWLTEVNYLGQLHHHNLVKLIGYCVEGEDRLLVYEFMPKGSLENHLFRRGPQPLSWSLRMKVAIGAARGLAFLHNAKSQVIYRDFKASNILLDAEFNAKLSDFGLAKAGPTGDRTHVSTEVMGTHGYAAPEYVATGRLTAKSDVYSFGVVLLELLSGRRAVDRTKAGVEQDLVDWAKPYLGDKRRLFRIMDTKLEGQYPQKGAFTAATLALQCLNREAKARPTMTEVLATLEQIEVPKNTGRNSQLEQKRVHVPARKSPAQNLPPLNVTPTAYPLPPRQPSPQVH